MKNGIKIKKLPTNQITDYFLYNNSPLLIPASSYGYSEKYVKELILPVNLIFSMDIIIYHYQNNLNIKYY